MLSPWHPPDLSVQSTPTEKTPYMGLNLNGCPLPLLLHKPFLSSLTGSINEPCSRGLRSSEHVCKHAQALQGKRQKAGAGYYMKNQHRIGLMGKGQAGMGSRATQDPPAPFKRLIALLAQVPTSYRLLSCSSPRPVVLFPVLNNCISKRQHSVWHRAQVL